MEKQLRREDRARKPKILKGSGRAAEPSAGSLKGYQLDPDHHEQALAHKKPRLTHNSPQAASGNTSQAPVLRQKASEVEEAIPTLAGQNGLCKSLLARHLNVEPRRRVHLQHPKRSLWCLVGKQKLLQSSMTSQDDDTIGNEALEETEIEEGTTDILEAVKASQLRDRYFAYNPTGQATEDYHSSDEDGDDQVHMSICFASLLVFCINLPSFNQSTRQLVLLPLSCSCIYQDHRSAEYIPVNNVEA